MYPLFRNFFSLFSLTSEHTFVSIEILSDNDKKKFKRQYKMKVFLGCTCDWNKTKFTEKCNIQKAKHRSSQRQCDINFILTSKYK